ncbi:MAG: diadenylate cyclase CdaA [Synergistaceae bacterium]|nr:diadenylate cyclase CdaA [Synergistaceae bacterium]
MWGNFRINDFFDIFVVALLINRALVFLAGTRAVQLIKGFLMLGVLAVVVDFFEFRLMSWIFNHFFAVLFIALTVLFQPELRNFLEEIGRGNLWRHRIKKEEAETRTEEILEALLYFKANKIGALLVFEQGTGLKEYWRSAVRINAKISQELIISIFWKDNPLHDGAAIINRNQIIAGACYLPLSENVELSRWFGTRHRAAIGITDVSDAIVLVASEERAEISMVYKGRLSRNMKEAQIRKLLNYYFSGIRDETRRAFLSNIKFFWRRFANVFSKN